MNEMKQCKCRGEVRKDVCLRDEFSFPIDACHSRALFECWQQMPFVGKPPRFACLCSFQRLWHLLPERPPSSYDLEQRLANYGSGSNWSCHLFLWGLVKKQWFLHFQMVGGKAKEEKCFVKYMKTI